MPVAKKGGGKIRVASTNFIGIYQSLIRVTTFSWKKFAISLMGSLVAPSRGLSYTWVGAQASEAYLSDRGMK